MNITDLIPELKEKKSGLESKITKNNNYETDYKEKNYYNPLTQMTINGKKYELETEQYENLMQILKEIGVKKEEIEEYDGGKEGVCFPCFGIKIENKLITKLQINDYNFKEIPKELWQLTELQVLQLEFNHSCDLYTLPAEIGQLTKLQGLHLQHNKMKILPPEIGKLTQLKIVYLQYNKISELPKEITQITALKYLNLWGNKIDDNDKIIQELKQKGVKVDAFIY